MTPNYYQINMHYNLSSITFQRKIVVIHSLRQDLHNKEKGGCTIVIQQIIVNFIFERLGISRMHLYWYLGALATSIRQQLFGQFAFFALAMFGGHTYISLQFTIATCTRFFNCSTEILILNRGSMCIRRSLGVQLFCQPTVAISPDFTDCN